MTAQATLTTDLSKVTANARAVVAALGRIEVVGATKRTCGSPGVGRALPAGGAVALGDARHADAERPRAAGVAAPLWLLRPPAPELAAAPRRRPPLSPPLRCHRAALHVTVRPQGVHSAGLTHGSWRGGTIRPQE